MILSVLSGINEELNERLSQKFGTVEEMVKITSLKKGQSDNLDITNKIASFLINIEEDGASKSGPFQSNPGANPSFFINLYIIYAAAFENENYPESLKYISEIISFFQEKNVFEDFDNPNINKIIVEMVNVHFQELSNFWNNIGSNYVPSVVYRFRMLNFSSNNISSAIGNII
ncbi:MAG: DUF4255 domain-containing protein [Bacteroidota bacterium]|nr:DUF4255 domain-containing protein [Bacteroidota bacterium]